MPYFASEVGTVDLGDWHDLAHSLQGSETHSDTGTWDEETLIGDDQHGRGPPNLGTVWKDNKLLILGLDG